MLAQDIYPELDISEYLSKLDGIAIAIKKRIADDAFSEQRVLALNYYLFNEMRFSGNLVDYYDPRNSYLNEVMERRTGIPITLSILYLEVGKRLGLNLKGVSFPGHFLVKLAVKRGQLVLDPFTGGEAQSESDLRQRLAQVLPSGKAEQAQLDQYLEPATPRQIIARVLRNLKNIYTQTGRLEHALAVMHSSCWCTSSSSASGRRCPTCRTTCGGALRRRTRRKSTKGSWSSNRPPRA